MEKMFVLARLKHGPYSNITSGGSSVTMAFSTAMEWGNEYTWSAHRHNNTCIWMSPWWGGNIGNPNWHYLSTCILDQDPNSTTVIEQLQFMHDIEKAESVDHHAKPLTKFLKRLEEWFKGGISWTLYFPAHFKQQRHWLSFKIDFEWCQLAYGEPLVT